MMTLSRRLQSTFKMKTNPTQTRLSGPPVCSGYLAQNGHGTRGVASQLSSLASASSADSESTTFGVLLSSTLLQSSEAMSQTSPSRQPFIRSQLL